FFFFFLEKKIFLEDPFVSLDQKGVGSLIKHGVAEGKKVQPKLKVGICGEHGGDPKSVIFCHGVPLDYVSCSPYRVPVARVAAAHAVLLEEK
ncbi:MAG: pyruvate, phosphate dikinase, partial [Deltaproteobacteria bacterium]|nr:pyruvate, phosphate dikinase [Deltaproteobacteria bacterium]